MKRKLASNFILLLASLLIGFAFCEIAVRILTSTDDDGQVYLKNKPLLPYRFPAAMVKKKLEHYFQNQNQAYVIDDDYLGWTIAPDHASSNGLYFSNSRGIRSAPYEYTLKPDPKVLRIALFGDSFTHGDELRFFQTWGYFLEKNLIEAGVSAEVINFGVGGYGIGQSYLRWNHLGKSFQPDIAIFGFQAENMQRTVNIIRSLYSRNTWLVFSKPRL
ncbi:MAG: SGNH/GDSL hydrolase family protein, partial [Candidatus Auribacterota bacterium]|nr:SGNH/GDSL hydrolase family protein [Candidatus Auribacterota bacterium]